MTALSKLLVLIAIFLLESHANAFTSMSPVAENQVQEKHWFRFEEPMNNPKNEPSCEPIREPTIRMDLDTELPNNLSLNQHESSNASLLVACAKCLNSNKSSCASLLVARAKCLKPQESSSASLLVARVKCLEPQESSSASLLVVLAKCLKPQESSCASKVARAKCLSTTKVSFSNNADAKTNNALSFRHTAFSTLQLVVASINDKLLKGSTKTNNVSAITTTTFLQLPKDNSAFMQISVPNDFPAITTSSFMQLYVPTMITSILYPANMMAGLATSKSLFLLCNIDNSEIMTPILLLNYVKDVPAIMVATHANYTL
jgi:hypothetical protein